MVVEVARLAIHCGQPMLHHVLLQPLKFGKFQESMHKSSILCIGHRQCCNRSGKPHILLIGSGGPGVCFTKRVQSYQVAFAMKPGLTG